MRDYLDLGPAPCNENCAALGRDDDFDVRNRRECLALIHQIRRERGEEPGSAQLKIKSNNHDYGVYREVVCYFDNHDEEGMNYAFKCETEYPEEWDTEARKELGLVSV